SLRSNDGFMRTSLVGTRVVDTVHDVPGGGDIPESAPSPRAGIRFLNRRYREEGSPGDPLTEDTKARRFRENVLSHLDAAYNLARWLSRSDTDAEDIVQEACLRAFRSFDGFRGDSARPWLLAIVRNSCYDWLRRNRRGDGDEAYDEEVHGGIDATPTAPELASPEALFERAETRQRIDAAIVPLPAAVRD